MAKPRMTLPGPSALAWHAMPCYGIVTIVAQATEMAVAMPCHAMPCHAMPCHAMPCHAMPCPCPCHAIPHLSASESRKHVCRSGVELGAKTWEPWPLPTYSWHLGHDNRCHRHRHRHRHATPCHATLAIPWAFLILPRQILQCHSMAMAMPCHGHGHAMPCQIRFSRVY
jgi:hypothetical protein